MVDGTRAAPSAREHHGVSIDDWAFVLAGLADGLDEEELLAYLGVDAERWQLASDAFANDVLDDVEAGGSLTEAFDRAMRAARQSWSRAIPPLDIDLRAWLDFYRAWASAEAPMDLLDLHGLRPPDIHRLQDLWTTRLAEAPALRDEAAAILSEPPGPIIAPRPEPARLRAKAPSREGVDGTAAAPARGAAPALPFSEGEPLPAPPKLSIPLPPPRRPPHPRRGDETRIAAPADNVAIVLPFSAECAANEPAPEARSTAAAARPLVGENDAALFSVERYAALCVDLIDAPDAHEAVLMRYQITAADKLALDVYWTRRMADDTTAWLAWDRACAEHRAGRSGGQET